MDISREIVGNPFKINWIVLDQDNLNREDAARGGRNRDEIKSRYQRDKYCHSYSGNDTQETRKGNYVET